MSNQENENNQNHFFQQDDVFLRSRYKKDGNKFILEMELDNPKHLFDRKDPSPLKGRDLNEDVVQYIIMSLREIPDNHPVILQIYFKEEVEELKSQQEKVADAIKTYFLFEEYNKNMELKLKFKRGFKALLIGLSFLFICISFHKVFDKNNEDLLWLYIREGLTVLGWASMWYPIHIFLYEWWPIKEEKGLYQRAYSMQILVTYNAKNLSLVNTNQQN